MKELEERVKELENAIRKHRDQRLDDRCWMDDDELYSVLNDPKLDNVDSGQRQLCEPGTMLENCKKFIASRHNPMLPYVSIQRYIEKLEARIKDLEAALK